MTQCLLICYSICNLRGGLICELMAHLCGGAEAHDGNQLNNELLADDLAASTES
jgi:hypothetical protein